MTNIKSSTVSVINGKTHKIAATIAVNPSLAGSYRIRDPYFPLIANLVGVYDITNMVYVTNTGSDTVSIIDGNTDSLLVKVGFSVNPPNSGNMQFNGQVVLPNTYFLYRNGTTCKKFLLF